jgi:hypothetical protein
VTHHASSLQYGDGLPREPIFIVLLNGAGRVPGQYGKAREDANEFNAPIASHCGSLILFVAFLKSGTDLHEFRTGMLIGIQR